MHEFLTDQCPHIRQTCIFLAPQAKRYTFMNAPKGGSRFPTGLDYRVRLSDSWFKRNINEFTHEGETVQYLVSYEIENGLIAK